MRALCIYFAIGRKQEKVKMVYRPLKSMGFGSLYDYLSLLTQLSCTSDGEYLLCTMMQLSDSNRREKNWNDAGD